MIITKIRKIMIDVYEKDRRVCIGCRFINNDAVMPYCILYDELKESNINGKKIFNMRPAELEIIHFDEPEGTYGFLRLPQCVDEFGL